jgi:predicted SprT family Zn-dependent metalloprotease
MEISQSKDLFKPSIEFLSKKYDELNEWLFEGKLKDCAFELFSNKTNTLGQFSMRKGVKFSKATREMFYQNNYGTRIPISYDNFELTMPKIGLNMDFERTELAWITTIAHEMCHYYTYMYGRAPKQAHGTEFKSIASKIKILTNNLINISTYSDLSMDGSKYTDEVQDKINRTTARKKNNMTALILYKDDGKIWLITSTLPEVIKRAKTVCYGKCNTIISVKDPDFIEYLWNNGYKNNMRSLRFWDIKNTKVEKDLGDYEYEVEYRKGDPVTFTLSEIKEMVKSVLDNINNEDNDDLVSLGDINLSLKSPIDL